MFTHRCRAAHELCEVPCNFGCIEYLFDGPTFPELRVGVVYRMSMVLTGCTAVNKTDGICGHWKPTNLRQMLHTSSVPHKILLCTIIEKARRIWAMIVSKIFFEFMGFLAEERNRRWSIGEVGPETSRFHALKAKGKCTFNLAIFYSVICLVQSS